MTPQREKIVFEPNAPQTVTLRYPEGKIVAGRFGEQVMYSLEGNQVMFLDLAVAQKINTLEPQPGESICICKRWNGQKGQPVRWDVWLSPTTEKMRAARGIAADGRTFVSDPERPSDAELVGQLRASVTHVNERRYNTLEMPRNGNGAAPAAPAPPAPVVPAPKHSGLVDEANALVDVFAAVLERALTMYQGKIKPEEVRSLVLSAYIQRGKAGGHA